MNTLKITIVYDNTSFQSNLKANWGFSCFIEFNDFNILFDTGTKGQILLNNMRELNIDPSIIDFVFISHSHHDHVGGLKDLLKYNDQAKIYVPSTLRLNQYTDRVIIVKESLQIAKNIFSTGTLKQIEQSMIIQTTKGLVIIAGCSHPGVRAILEKSSEFGEPYALIGGLHGFNEFHLVEKLRIVCPTHCTKYISALKQEFPEKYVQGGVGEIIEL